MNVESMGNHHSISYMMMMMLMMKMMMMMMMIKIMMMMIKIVNSAVTSVPSFLREGSKQAIRCDEITMMIIML
jgi:hypothetical protein